MLRNLISNAIKHHPDPANGTINVSCVDKGDHVRISVADDGIGLSGDVDIEKSNSMGLEIVLILTQQLDGQLSLNSGGGTEFRVEFPRRIVDA